MNNLFIGIFFFLTASVKAQDFQFQAGINASDITGDDSYSYQKPGVYASFGYISYFYNDHNNWWYTGIAFSQKGSRIVPDIKNNDTRDYNLRLNYLEVPVNLRFQLKQIIGMAGIHAGYLINHTEEFMGIPLNAPASFNKFELSGVAGVGLTTGKKCDIIIRGNYSILRVRDSFSGTRWYFARGSRNSLFSLIFSYKITDKGPQVPEPEEPIE